MIRDETSDATRPKPRWWLIALLAALHLLALLGLARIFAPDFTAAVVEQAGALVTIPVTPPPSPAPPPSPKPNPAPDEGAAGTVGRKAIPRAAVAPVPRIPLPITIPMPIAPAAGLADSSGAADQGSGAGTGGSGEGSGRGRSGDGMGGEAVASPVKTAGEIDNAEDYPVPPGGRATRLGHSVTIYMTVTVAGRATDCRVVEPSPDPVADRITCELAEQRFRFRPARNAAGEPVAATFGWRQGWFRK